ncbi:MAG: hypothetical protein II855_04730 [Candidatus Methanomethylophilaceae archaeon]|jgi:hypothetical protein|nr:hypothetical protein [Candidatus Methanomethylophilaceae archaeon]
MDDNTKKKLGVWIILVISALYVASIVMAAVFIDVPAGAVIGYAVVMFIILALLIYEGWERIKEIDGGLEDAVDNY